MSTPNLEKGVQHLTKQLDREIEDLRRKIVDRVLRIAADAEDLRKRVNTEGADGANTSWIAANMGELAKFQASLAERERARHRIEEMVRFARRSAS